MSAHTPGPWKSRDYKTAEGDIWIDCDSWTNKGPSGRARGGTLATALATGCGAGAVEANARLIAAAPDLLAACDEAEAALELFASSTCCDGDDNDNHEEKCKVGRALVVLYAARAKARGGK